MKRCVALLLILTLLLSACSAGTGEALTSEEPVVSEEVGHGTGALMPDNYLDPPVRTPNGEEPKPSEESQIYPMRWTEVSDAEPEVQASYEGYVTYGFSLVYGDYAFVAPDHELSIVNYLGTSRHSTKYVYEDTLTVDINITPPAAGKGANDSTEIYVSGYGHKAFVYGYATEAVYTFYYEDGQPLYLWIRGDVDVQEFYRLSKNLLLQYGIDGGEVFLPENEVKPIDYSDIYEQGGI